MEHKRRMEELDRERENDVRRYKENSRILEEERKRNDFIYQESMRKFREEDRERELKRKQRMEEEERKRKIRIREHERELREVELEKLEEIQRICGKRREVLERENEECFLISLELN